MPHCLPTPTNRKQHARSEKNEVQVNENVLSLLLDVDVQASRQLSMDETYLAFLNNLMSVEQNFRLLM